MSIKELNDFSSHYKNLAYCNYYFINYNEDISIVVRISNDCNEIESVNIYYKTIYSQDVISKIQYGMTIEDIVKLIGNPIGAVTFGINSLDFSINRDTVIRIQLTDDLKVLYVSENIN